MKKLSAISYQLSAGFTLIELLVVVAILAVLSSLLLSNVSSARERARDAKRKSDLNQIKSSLRMYYNDFNEYPEDGSDGVIAGCGTTASPEDCSWGEEFKKNDMVYMKVLPNDPTPASSYVYAKVDDENFRLYAILENKSDPDAGGSRSRCGAVSPPDDSYYVCAD